MSPQELPAARPRRRNSCMLVAALGGESITILYQRPEPTKPTLSGIATSMAEGDWLPDSDDNDPSVLSHAVINGLVTRQQHDALLEEMQAKQGRDLQGASTSPRPVTDGTREQDRSTDEPRDQASAARRCVRRERSSRSISRCRYRAGCGRWLDDRRSPTPVSLTARDPRADGTRGLVWTSVEADSTSRAHSSGRPPCRWRSLAPARSARAG